jgi:hypothetical protein
MSSEQAHEAAQRVVKLYRAPRATPRPEFKSFDCFEDPAPQHLSALAYEIAKHTGNEPDHGFAIIAEALAWCAAGDSLRRAVQLMGFVGTWIGPRVPMLRLFLDNARKTRGGRREQRGAA